MDYIKQVNDEFEERNKQAILEKSIQENDG
jgi:hypothetical protein